jgi:hypothetical protein
MVSLPYEPFELKILGILRKTSRIIAPKTELFSCRFCARFLEIGGQITASKKLLVKRQCYSRRQKLADAGSTGIQRPNPML